MKSTRTGDHGRAEALLTPNNARRRHGNVTGRESASGRMLLADDVGEPNGEEEMVRLPVLLPRYMPKHN